MVNLHSLLRHLLARPVNTSSLPDASRTPGLTNPNVTQDNIRSTIGKRGWTRTIRPPASYTDSLKRRQMQSWRLPGRPQDYEEDHLIALELGGHPTDERNLWPDPWEPLDNKGAGQKDKVENTLHKAVMSGRISLTEAQIRIATNWQTATEDL